MSYENNRGIALLYTAYKVLMNMPQIRAIHRKCKWGRPASEWEGVP